MERKLAAQDRQCGRAQAKGACFAGLDLDPFAPAFQKDKKRVERMSGNRVSVDTSQRFAGHLYKRGNEILRRSKKTVKSKNYTGYIASTQSCAYEGIPRTINTRS